MQCIITNSAINGPTKFRDCEDYRHSCEPSGTDNNNCPQ